MNPVFEAITKRRTSKDFDGRLLPRSFLEAALEAANFAPNHRLNQPWRFKVLSPQALNDWTRDLKSKLSPEELAAMTPALDRVQKVGALIFVSCLRDSNPTMDFENYAATSAAIQNILLYATAEGIQSYWSTGKVFSHSETLHYFQIPETERFVGAIWLGYAKSSEPKARKHYSEFTRWL